MAKGGNGYDEQQLAKMLGVGSGTLRELARRGVLRPGMDMAAALVAVSRHLFATRNSEDAKARAAEAEAQLKEARARRAMERLQQPTEVVRGGQAKRSVPYSWARAQRICELISCGYTTERALGEVGISADVWTSWRRKHPEAADLFAQARVERIHELESELHTIAVEMLDTARASDAPSHRVGAYDKAFNQRLYLLGVYKRHVFGSAAERAAVAAQEAAGGGHGEQRLSREQEEELVRRIAEQKARILECKKDDDAEDVE